jgi:hypothetical protein
MVVVAVVAVGLGVVAGPAGHSLSFAYSLMYNFYLHSSLILPIASTMLALLAR